MKKGVRISELVDHGESVPAETCVEGVAARFRCHSHEFMAVCEGPSVVGLCSRSQVGALLSGRYGFALHSRIPIGQRLLRSALMFPTDGDVHDLLAAAFSREGDAFLHDAVIVDPERHFVGLVSARRLITAQSWIVRHQLARLESQSRELTHANDELSRSLEHRQLLERQIVQKEKSALVQTLVGGIAHELNNKLLPVLGYSELLMSEVSAGDTSRVMPYSRTLRAAAGEAANIVRQLLQLSRPVAMERQRFDLREVIEQSLTLTALRARDTGAAIEVTAPDDGVYLMGDPSQIKQVIVNLVLNALDALEGRPDGRVHIAVRVEGGRSVTAVRDWGAGIPKEHLPRIFDPFFTTKAPSHGTGLGLGVCASIARLHGGAIAVESIEGSGSTFTLSLPLAAEAAMAETAPCETHSPDGKVVAGRSVLVVDDDDRVAQVICDTLERRFGLVAERVADGAEAQRVLEARHYDLIICDVRMPVLGGLALLAWMRARHPSQASKLVLMTGEMGQTSLDQEILVSAVPVLRKPFTSDALSHHVHAILGTPSASTVGRVLPR